MIIQTPDGTLTIKVNLITHFEKASVWSPSNKLKHAVNVFMFSTANPINITFIDEKERNSWYDKLAKLLADSP